MMEAIGERAKKILVFAAGVYRGVSRFFRTLQDTARAIRSDSLIRKVRAEEIRGARSLHGASDLDDIPVAASLRDAVLCGDCLARKTGVPRWKMSDVVTHLQKTVKVNSVVARCDGCLKHHVVYSLG